MRRSRPLPRYAKPLRIIACALLVAAAFCADARMYQWVNPGTRTVQLSGEPPAWYRGESGGPRVFVFENGRLVDDTARPVSETEGAALRDAAFGAAAPSAPPPGNGTLNQIREAVTAPASPRSPEPANNPVAQPTVDSPALTVEAFKALVKAWDEQGLSRARALIEDQDGATAAP